MMLGTEHMWQVRHFESFLFLAIYLSIYLLLYRTRSSVGCDFKIMMPHLLDVLLFLLLPF
jgi:hypothetical protein